MGSDSIDLNHPVETHMGITKKAAIRPLFFTNNSNSPQPE